MVTSSDAVVKRLGWDPRAAMEDVKAVPPNPLVIASRRQKLNRCEVITENGPCPEYVGYWDAYREQGLCIIHASAVNQLPDSVARRQATVEMTVTTLTNMTQDAVRVLGEIMVDEEVNPAVRLKAVDMVLSKTGFVSGQNVSVSVQDQPVHEAQVSDMIRERLNRLAPTALETGAAVLPFNRESEDQQESP